MGWTRSLGIGWGLLAVGWVMGCRPVSEAPSPGTLVVTQIPGDADEHAEAHDVLDIRYPRGSRLVRVDPSQRSDRAVVLSGGLWSAGSPALGPDGISILFAGKASTSNAWQIYRVAVSGGPPEPLTALPEGAMDPAWLPGGRFVFSSPVPRAASRRGEGAANDLPALYTLSVTGGIPSRLTFGRAAASDPTVLPDGRILFVSGMPGGDVRGEGPTSLFTINNDGTEVTAFAGQHDPPALLRRPRDAGDGRVIFLAASPGSASTTGRVEQVLMARPFRSRSVSLESEDRVCRSVEPAGDGTVLAGLDIPGGRDGFARFAIFRLGKPAGGAGVPVFDDPSWNDVEAVPATWTPRLTGRLSTVDPSRRDAVLLCLDTGVSDRPKEGIAVGHGIQVRMLGCDDSGGVRILGNAPVHGDGSFLVTVPADVALGVELLDARGAVVRRCPPVFWLRPGENRACVGCHEPHNRAPENRRPRAVLNPPVSMVSAGLGLAETPESSP